MAESIQKRLLRERPPRVKITYDVETGGAVVKTELPFVMGVIADLSGDRDKTMTEAGVEKTVMRNGGETKRKVAWQDYADRAFVEIDKDNFSEVLAEFAPRFKYTSGKAFKDLLVANGVKDVKDPSAIIGFNTLEDFTPDRIVATVQPFRSALARHNLVRDLYTRMDTDAKLLADCHAYLTQKFENAEDKKNLSLGAGNEEYQKYIIEREEHLKGTAENPLPAGKHPPLGDNSRELIRRLIAEVVDIDKLIAAEMDTILHNEKFQKIEAAWRGLFSLVRNTATGAGLKLKVLNATKDELHKDLDGALDFDQSRLFKMVYEETYGTQGGHPFSCLLHAHAYDKTDESVALATKMTTVAASAHAPLLAAAAPELFNLKDSFRDLAAPRDLAKIFESAEHTKWNSLRGQEDSRYLTLCLPRVLMRAPYGRADTEKFAYEESLGGDATKPDHACYLWGNAAYALGARITAAFALYGWTAAIRGMEGGGLVEDLPLHSYTRASGDIVTKIPTETAVTDRREKELSDLGFIALCHRLGTDKAVFFGGQTVNKPIKYLDDDATANAALSARLPYMLNASRFAHYVKSIMRDKTGSFQDRESVEVFLNKWLAAYVLLSDDASQAVKASYPLREGRVDVTEDESNPGAYRAVMYLRPHFQMEELEVSIRLVAKLPAPMA